MQTHVSPDEIINYYDKCQVDYKLLWHLNSRMSMHYGYWDDSTPNLRSALTNLNVKVAEMAGIKNGAHVLDAGCGVGGSSIFLAKNFGCKTMGITLSEKQVATCNANATAQNVNDFCKFDRQTYLNTSFPDGTFDVVWAIESVCHANEKADFLREAFRVLKKGGTLILADFFRQTDDIQADKNKLMEKWSATWAVPDFEYYKSFEQKAADNGFTGIEMKNITGNIYPSARRLYYCFIPGIICDSALRIIGKRSKAQNANVWSTYYQSKSLKKNLWNYYIFKAIKS